jgi:hypothetical protein
MSVYRNNVAVTVSGTPGTGNITQGSALAGAQSLTTAYGAGTWSVDIDARGTGVWTVERDCSLNGATGVITRGTVEDGSSGPGVRVSLPADTVVRVAVPADVVNALDNFLGAWGVLSGENAITGTATALIGRLNVCSGTTSDYTVTLPAVSGNAGRYIGFIMAAGLTRRVTLDGNGSETIDGALTRVMWAREAALLYCDGTTWTKVAGRPRPMMASMIHASGPQSIAHLTPTKILVNSAILNNTGAMVNVANRRIDILRRSMYRCVGFSVIELGATAVRALSQVYATVNGSSIQQRAASESYGVSGSYPTVPAVAELELWPGDFVEVWGFHTAGSSQPLFVGNPGGSQIMVTEMPEW